MAVGLNMPVNVVLGCLSRAILSTACAWLLFRRAAPSLRPASWVLALFQLAWTAMLLTRVGWEVIRVIPSQSVQLGDARDVTSALALWVRACVTFTLTLGYLWMIVRQLEARLVQQATEDPLTGVGNRRVLWEKGERLIARAHQRGGRVAVLMVDVDHFKSVNDRWGHAIGDLLLIKVAEMIGATIRASDIMGRVGGEEFAVLLPDADTATAAGVAERVRKAVEELTVNSPKGIVKCSVSIGYADLVADVEWDGLIDAADQALYRAKAAGRNRVEGYSWQRSLIGDEDEAMPVLGLS